MQSEWKINLFNNTTRETDSREMGLNSLFLYNLHQQIAVYLHLHEANEQKDDRASSESFTKQLMVSFELNDCVVQLIFWR